MIFAAYLGSSTLVFLLVLLKRVFFNRAGTQPQATSHQVWIYTFKTVIFVLLGLFTFTILSVWLGLLKFGVISDFHFPQDYIEGGLMGWLTMAIALSGVLSPLIASKTTRS